jgi:hypothetical protein
MDMFDKRNASHRTRKSQIDKPLMQVFKCYCLLNHLHLVLRVKCYHNKDKSACLSSGKTSLKNYTMKPIIQMIGLKVEFIRESTNQRD